MQQTTKNYSIPLISSLFYLLLSISANTQAFTEASAQNIEYQARALWRARSEYIQRQQYNFPFFIVFWEELLIIEKYSSLKFEINCYIRSKGREISSLILGFLDIIYREFSLSMLDFFLMYSSELRNFTFFTTQFQLFINYSCQKANHFTLINLFFDSLLQIKVQFYIFFYKFFSLSFLLCFLSCRQIYFFFLFSYLIFPASLRTPCKQLKAYIYSSDNYQLLAISSGSGIQNACLCFIYDYPYSHYYEMSSNEDYYISFPSCMSISSQFYPFYQLYLLFFSMPQYQILLQQFYQQFIN